MNTAEITIEQIVGMARQLKTQELASLVSRLEAMLKGAFDIERIQAPVPHQSVNGALADSGPVPSEGTLDHVPSDLEFAAAVAPIEKAWQQSGMTMEELMIVLDDIRKDISRREFGHLLEDES
jgi:hypothetical protein